MIYADNNATTQLDPSVFKAMIPWMTEKFSNADSIYTSGKKAHTAIEKARTNVAELLDCSAKNIFFTSSASEANNTILKGYVGRYRNKSVIYTSSVEHSSIKEPIVYLGENNLCQTTFLEVDEFGKVIVPEKLQENSLLSVIAANNVIHTLNDLYFLSDYTLRQGIFFHTDATQLIGKKYFSIKSLNIDALSFSGHKIYGPKGVGVMYLSDKFKIKAFTPLIHGGKQEGRFRAGTSNTAAIVGIGEACLKVKRECLKESSRLSHLTSSFLQNLKQLDVNYEINGHLQDRLPGGINISFPGVDASSLLDSLPELEISKGSACDDNDPSHIFRAIGKMHLANASIRIQFGRFNKDSDAEKISRSIANALHNLGTSSRNMYKF